MATTSVNIAQATSNQNQTKNQNQNQNQAKTKVQAQPKVLYYSVTINNYNDIMNIVNNTLFTMDDVHSVQGIYVKTSESFDKFGLPLAMTDELKKTVEDTFALHINKLKPNDHFMIHNDKMYTVNSEFHITTLFVGGKANDKSQELEDQINKKVLVKVNKLGVSDSFIALSVESIKFENDSDASYYGNPIRHITVALNKTGPKVLPKDSYTALENGQLYDLDSVVEGKCDKS